MNIIYTPKFKIVLDKGLDLDWFTEFTIRDSSMVEQFFPGTTTKDEVVEIIENTYHNKIKDLKNTASFLNDNIPVLEKIATIISQLLDCSWDGIKEITIVPAVCPVCPRFIGENKFMVAYYFDRNAILNICAHEMAHFLYFKKLRELLHVQNIDTEYPGNDWLISEIVAPLITDNNDIQALVKYKDDFLSIPNNIEISDEKIKKITKLFHEKSDLKDFRKKSLSELSL